MIKIIFISHNIFGFGCLQHLVNLIKNYDNIKIELVVTRKETNNLCDQTLEFSDFCQNNNLKCIQTENLKNDTETSNLIKSIKTDYLFVFGWSQLIPNDILETTNKLNIGSHPSMLPLFRGNAAIPWQILHNTPPIDCYPYKVDTWLKYNYHRSGVTLFELVDKVDAGRIIEQISHKLDARETSTTLYYKSINLCKHLLTKLIKNISEDNVILINQTNSPSFGDIMKPSDSFIDWKLHNVDNLIRAKTFPYPSAYTYMKINDEYKKIHILEASPANIWYHTSIGNIINHDNKIYVSSGGGILLLHKISVDDIIYEPIDFFKRGQRFDINMNDLLFELYKDLKTNNKLINEKKCTCNISSS